MSAIRYFDNVPHIVRYGMHDDKTEKFWIFFWRNGVRFKIFVDGEDVQDTQFYTQWKPLLREHARGEMPLSQWVVNQWHPLCDLIISTSMPTLRQLAPDREHWTTLRDYLHTPAYQLRLIASDQRTEILTKVEEGPTNTGAYELAPVSEDKLPLPASLQRYESKDLQVLNRAKDWRHGPAKVSTSDGSIFYFLGCQQDTRAVKTQQVSNSSLDAIRAQLRTLEARSSSPSATPPVGISQVYGVVTDTSACQGSSGEPSSKEGEQDAESSEHRIAGLLLTWIPQGRTLAETAKSLTGLSEIDLRTKIQAWKARVESALAYLHQNGVYLGGRADWPYLNQYTVMIDAHGESWLTTSYATSVAGVSTGEAEEGMKRDDQALVSLFEEWLLREVAKHRSA